MIYSSPGPQSTHNHHHYFSCRPVALLGECGVSLLDDGLPDFYTNRVLPDRCFSTEHFCVVMKSNNEGVNSCSRFKGLKGIWACLKCGTLSYLWPPWLSVLQSAVIPPSRSGSEEEEKTQCAVNLFRIQEEPQLYHIISGARPYRKGRGLWGGMSH